MTTSEDSILKTFVKASINLIPSLSLDNYTIWLSRMENCLELMNFDIIINSPTEVFKPLDNLKLKSLLIGKLDNSLHTNIITPENKNDAKAIWLSIKVFFASSEASNRARVFFNLLYIALDINNITTFITKIKEAVTRLSEVGIILPPDILAYLIVFKFPSSLDNIKTQITHSERNIDTDLVLNHLQLYSNDQKTKFLNKGASNTVSMMANRSVQHMCKLNWHNPESINHAEDNCWFKYPEKRPKHHNFHVSAHSFNSFSSASWSLISHGF